jgi:hypothetical protein
MIFIVKYHSNKNNKYKNESQQFRQAQILNGKQHPTKPKWKMTTIISSPIRDNDRQLPLIGNHTRQKQQRNRKHKFSHPDLTKHRE